MQFRLRLILAFLSTTLAFAATAMAQTPTTGQVYGGVVDRDDRQVISGATITLQNLRNGHPNTAYSNDKGSYFFKLVEPGSYVLRAVRPRLPSRGVSPNCCAAESAKTRHTCFRPDENWERFSTR